MENTNFLKLKKPDELDQYAVDDFNSNMDTIDLAVEKLEEMSVEMASDGSPRYFLSTQNTMPEFYDVGKFIGKSEVVVPVAPDTGVEAEIAKFSGITYPQSKELLAGKATGAFYLWSDRTEPFVATAKLYKMLASGDIELIAENSVDVSNVNQNVPTSISIDIVEPVTLAVNERILYKVYATIGVVGQVVNFAFGGSSRPSRVVLPMNDEHNDLVGIQGGTTAERYHLTRDQHDKNLLNDGDASNVKNRFTIATVRENLADGELLKISLGKLMKWFADLKPVAWSGNASDLVEDASNRLVTDSEKSTWNGKLNTNGNASNVTNTFTQASSRANLTSGESLGLSLGKLMKWFADLKPVAWSGNTSDLVEDASNRLVTDSEKSTWNAKASTAVVTTSANGLMSSTDKTKLDGVASNANNYIHPSTHPATVIVQDASNRFVTDSEKNTWNGKASTAVATTSTNGLMSSTDKIKLDGVASNANNYTHPSTHPATMVVQDASNRFVTDSEKSTWNGKLSTNGNASNVTNTFTQAASRANLTSGESLSLSLGKLMKWFADLKPVAWSGSTLDLAEPNALSNIGTSANAKQNTVNIEVDERIGSMIQTKSATTGSAGWYRIATSVLGIQRNYATFDIDWYLSSHHGRTTLIAGNMYGEGTELTQLGYSEFGSNNVTKARIVYHTTYSNNYAYLEVYCATASLPLNVRMHDSTGWILTAPSTVGNVPSGYVSKELIFNDGITTLGEISAGIGMTANGTVSIEKSGGESIYLRQTDSASGFYNFVGWHDSENNLTAWTGYASDKSGDFEIENKKGDIKLEPESTAGKVIALRPVQITTNYDVNTSGTGSLMIGSAGVGQYNLCIDVNELQAWYDDKVANFSLNPIGGHTYLAQARACFYDTSWSANALDLFARNHTGAGGVYIGFYPNKSDQGTQYGYIGYAESDWSALVINNGGVGANRYVKFDAYVVAPRGDANGTHLGASNLRWEAVWSADSSINTSDMREKQQISEIPDEWLDAWEEVNFIRYKWNRAVETKGEEKARWHVGVIAQEIERVFMERGLNAFEIGIIGYDEWEEQKGIEADGTEIIVVEKGNRYSIRPDECHFLELALQRRATARLQSQTEYIQNQMESMQQEIQLIKGG